jgi:hypothetical protein
MQSGEHLLDKLEVLTAGDRWLPVEEYPIIYINIEPEPQDDTPVFSGIHFHDPL